MNEQYLVTECYRSALTIGYMRCFDNVIDAWKYYDTLDKSLARIYKVSNISPPILLKEKDRAVFIT